jgi:hypothetical protein
VAKFKHVFYCAGNHELWQSGGGDTGAKGFARDGVEKLLAVMTRVTELGAHAAPALVGGGHDASDTGVAIVPMQSWYQPGFLEGPGSAMSGDNETARAMDAGVKWPAFLVRARELHGPAIAEFFGKLNRQTLSDVATSPMLRGLPIVSFSHFLPHPGLHRGYRWLSHFEGSHTLGAQLGQLHKSNDGAACTHVFGHTHFSIDTSIDGVRYVQHPLGNPHERKNGWQIHTSEHSPLAKVWP